MRRIILILTILLSTAAPFQSLHAQEASDPTHPLHTATHGTMMGRYRGLRGWVVSIEERTYRYIPDDSAAVTAHPRPLAPDSVSCLYHFDPHGNIISIVVTSWSQTDFNVQETIAFVYDHRARLSRTVLIAEEDTTALLQYFYNDTTDCIRLVSCPPWGAIRRIQYEYSPRGVCKTTFDSRNRPLLQTCYRDGRMVSMIDYDSYSGDPRQLLTVARHDAGGLPLLLADALQPDNTALQISYEFDPYGNPTLLASDGDTVIDNYTLYDLRHNWLRCEHIDNGRPSMVICRTIRYAADSSDFANAYRLYDPFWNENNPTGFLEVHYPNGDYYLGNLLQGQPHGTGDLVFADGTSFSGSFDHGRYHGAGVLKRGGTEIHATWQHGKVLTNYVEISYPDSSYYRGAFHPEGDSCRYKGRTQLPGNGYYEGEYALERYDGEGTLRLGDGTLCEGTWERGKPHGEMLIVMPNLDRHRARFSHGRRVGDSTIEYINGDLYCGETDQQGLPDGMGTYTTAAGKARTGYWSNGQYKGRHRPAVRNTKH